MASEKALSNRLRDKMRDHWTGFKRHEDKLEKGVADCSFAIPKHWDGEDWIKGRHCWMELKQHGKWPARASTVLRLDHFTIHQRHWLADKGNAAGDTWLLLQVGRDHLLFSYQQLDIVGTGTKQQLIDGCTSFWEGGLPYGGFFTVLKTGC